MTVDERMPKAEVLGHSGQGVVDSQVAMRVKATHDIAHDLGALGMRAVRSQSRIGHPVKDSAVDRLEAVTDIGKRPRHDHRHGVLEVGTLHLLLELDRLDGADRTAVTFVPPRRARARCARVVPVALCHEPECLRYLS